MFEKEVKKILKKSLKIRKLKQEKLTDRTVFIQYDGAFGMFSISFYKADVCKERISIDLDGKCRDETEKEVKKSMNLLDDIIRGAQLRKQEKEVCEDV